MENFAPDIPNFKYLGHKTFTCVDKTNTLAQYQHCLTGMIFILLPGGSFSMGSPEQETCLPVHTVQISPFLMSQQFVDLEVWQNIMHTTPNCQEEVYERLSDGKSRKIEGYSIVNVSWLSAQEFCKATGLFLPSESQWEYACRAGTTTKYYWGDELFFSDETFNARLLHTTKLELKPYNAFGLCDMLGNAWQWCADSLHDNYVGAPLDGSAWLDESSPFRMIRGSVSWDWAMICDCAFRGKADVHTDKHIGFHACAGLPATK